jgi:hypothetical protein
VFLLLLFPFGFGKSMSWTFCDFLYSLYLAALKAIADELEPVWYSTQ